MNLLDLVKGYITPDVIRAASNGLGENESGISKAISGILPTIFSGLLQKSDANDGASSIFSFAQQAASSGLLNNLGNVGALTNLFSNNSTTSALGTSILSSLFGNKLNGIISTLAGFAGIRESSASSLMNLAAPLSMAVLGKQATENKLGATGLMSLLASQKDSILSMVPSGFNLASLLGLGSLASLGTNALSGVKSVANVAEDAAEEGAGFMRWLLPLLLLGAAIAALVYFARGCGGATTVEEPVKKEEVKKEEPKKEEVKAPATTESKGSFDEKTGNYIYDIGGIFKLKLPNNGGELEVGEFSSERKLFDMLNDPNFKVDEQDKSKGWFSLDRVYFETGKSSLTAESQAQLERTAKILKAFPTAELKLGGYTDNTGAADMNKKLSGDRAKMVLDKLVALGVAATRLKSEGYGPEHPICAPNDTPACKAQNRRVDLRVTKK